MTLVHAASISDQIATWYDQIGPWLFYGVVWALVFAGTGLFIGAFVPFVTGDSLVFAAGLVALDRLPVPPSDGRLAPIDEPPAP